MLYGCESGTVFVCFVEDAFAVKFYAQPVFGLLCRDDFGDCGHKCSSFDPLRGYSLDSVLCKARLNETNELNNRIRNCVPIFL